MKVASTTKDYDVLNLTEKQVDKFIEIAEADVAAGLVLLQEKQVPYKEAEQLFIEAKADYDTASTKLSENKLLLEELVRYRNNKRGDKDLRVLRATSNLDQPRPQQVKEFKWLPLAVGVLSELNRFVSPDDLYIIILQKNPEIQKSIDKKKARKEFRSRVTATLKKACEINPKRKRGKQQIVVYKEKIGLFEWVDEEMIPKPSFMKDFMFRNLATA
ncbi:MAG TPA: hypothetical protein VGM30_10670 [Puia sp.]|jgi:hypothetical protein